MTELDAYDYPLPPGCIAQEPAQQRDHARLLVLDRRSGGQTHTRVDALPSLLAPGDLLVRNATRVLPARLRGHKHSGGRAEALLLERGRSEDGRYRALVRCRGKLRPGLKLRFEHGENALEAELSACGEDGVVELAFPPGSDPYALGEPPLPPYITRAEALPADDERYQTVYARVAGSVAAPTAGLHFTAPLDAALRDAGVAIADVVLHVGAGTFRPLRDRDLRAGRLHAEAFELPEATATAIDRTRGAGGRVIAVGTTTTRVLETQAREDGCVESGSGETELLLQPGARFRVVDGLLTNFHLPRSSLLLLVAAFAGRQRVLDAYAEAVRRDYRFYSYGDAMLVL